MSKKQDPKKIWNIAPRSEDEVDVLIYGDIGYDWWEGTDNTAVSFQKEWKAIESKYKRANVRINSVGGSLYDGLPIYNMIKSSPLDVHTYIDGVAYSMAAIIALAGNTVHAYRNSMFLLHAAINGVYGNAGQLREEAENLDRYTEGLAQNVADKTGLTIEEVKNKWFDYKDHLMTATEAHAAGLIDIIEDNDADMPENVANMSHTEIAAYCRNSMPKDQNVLDTIRRIGNSIFNHNSIQMKDAKRFASVLNVSEDEDKIFDAVQALISKNSEADTKVNQLTSELAEQNTQISNHVAEISNLKETIANAPVVPVPGTENDDPKDDVIIEGDEVNEFAKQFAR